MVEETLFRLHLDYAQPQPGGDYLAAMTASWSQHLRGAGVPWHEVPRIYEAALATKAQGKGRGFMLTVDDLLHAWDGVIEGGYWEQQNTPPDATLPALPPGQNLLPGGVNTDWAPAFVRAFAQARHVTCHCAPHRFGRPSARLVEADGIRLWVCAEGLCGFRLGADEATANAPDPTEQAPQVLAEAGAPSDEELLRALSERCGLDVGKCGHDEALAFGRRMLERVPIAKWTNRAAREEWRAWKETEEAEDGSAHP